MCFEKSSIVKKCHPVYATVAGFCLIAIGLSLCRFAYAPLIPSMIDHHWVTASGAGYLGGFNFLGYLIGCGAALFLPRRTGVTLLMRFSLVLAVIGQSMCVWDLGFAWLALARFLAGLAGASLVIHAPAVVLKHISERWKTVVNGVVFAGAGATIVFVRLLLPAFLTISVNAGWMFEAGLTLIAAVIAWPIARSTQPAAGEIQVSLPKLERPTAFALLLIGTAYFLAAISITPHTLFLPDYLHHRFGTTAAVSSRLFSLVGLGSLVGALTSGVIARLLGTQWALMINYLLGAIGILMVLVFANVTLITVSAFLIGFFLLCCVPLTSVRCREISGRIRASHDWGVLTLMFGVGLAVGSYGMSGLLSLDVSYYQLFVIAQVTSLASLLLSIWLLKRKQQQTASNSLTESRKHEARTDNSR